MKQLNNSILIYSDANYKHSVNYSSSLYHSPVTLNFGNKHNRSKYILSAGNCDDIDIFQEGIFLYVITQNIGLNYIGLEVINTELKEVEGNVFLSDSDLNDEENICFNLLDKTNEEQIKILLKYIQ